MGSGAAGKEAVEDGKVGKTSAVLFDLYETLITEFVPAWRPRPSMAERLGTDADAYAAAWRRHQTGRFRGEYPDYPSVLRAVCRTLGLPSDESLIERLHEERLAEKAAPFARVEGEILRMLERLREKGVLLGVVSNCAPEEVAAWHGCALAPYFDAVVFSCQVGACKPEPGIYRLACERLGVPVEEAVFIGDGGSDELAGAARAGLRPYWATWFLDRWPAWKRSEAQRLRSAPYPRLHTPNDLLKIVPSDGGEDATSG